MLACSRNGSFKNSTFNVSILLITKYFRFHAMDQEIVYTQTQYTETTVLIRALYFCSIPK